MMFQVIKMSDHDCCDCCGRSGLKRTVHLLNLDTQEEVFYGVNCASTALRQKYQGKIYKVSVEAIKDMAYRAPKQPHKTVLHTPQSKPSV